MKALVLIEIRQPLQFQERKPLNPAPGEVIVQLRAAALNRRDYWITQGLYPGITTPVVPGSDGAGVVDRVGEGVDSTWVGREVIINPGLDWGDDEAAQSAAFNILGLPRDGTFANEVAVPATQLHPRPAHLNWHEAAALPLSGTTAWRAVFTQGKLQSGKTVLITGIGGGVAGFALQFAVAAGAQVWVTSSSSGKVDRAVSLGARGGFDYTDADWSQQFIDAAGAPDLVIDSAGGAGYGTLVKLVAPGGRIVNYGATTGPAEKIDLFKLFWKQLHLIGTSMGSPQDFASMIQFVSDHRIAPLVEEILPLERGHEAVELMRTSPQFGKYVLDLS